MPAAVFAPGTVTSVADLLPRSLIPGVAPGGSRVGQPLKPALLITDARLVLRDIRDTGATAENQNVEVFLKLSQDNDLVPGLNLQVGNVFAAKTGTAGLYNDIEIYQTFRAQGTVWAPQFVGMRVQFPQGTPTAFIAEVHLDYEQVEIPWMEWFLRWEFLDNVTNDSEEY